MSQVRQPELCETEPFVRGNFSGQYDGQDKEGKGEGTVLRDDSMSKGTFDENNKDERSNEKGNETDMSYMQQNQKSRGKEENKPKSPTVPTSLVAREDGKLVGGTLEEQYRLSKAYHLSGLMPATLNSPEKILVAMQICYELKLPPMSAISKIAVINGSAALFGDLPLALVLRAGDLVSIEEFWVDQEYQVLSWKNKNLNQEPYAAICVVKRKGQRQGREFHFTLDDARKAGLFPTTNTSKPWHKYTRTMMKMRARSQALKDMFPDALNGIKICEYDEHVLPDHNGYIDPKSIQTNAAQDLHNALLEEGNTNTLA